MNAQPEALELAEKLEAVPFIGFVYDGQPGTEDPFLCKQAAAELRRLHELTEVMSAVGIRQESEILCLHNMNAELVEALINVVEAANKSNGAKSFTELGAIGRASAAIRKATGEQQ